MLVYQRVYQIYVSRYTFSIHVFVYLIFMYRYIYTDAFCGFYFKAIFSGYTFSRICLHVLYPDGLQTLFLSFGWLYHTVQLFLRLNV